MVTQTEVKDVLNSQGEFMQNVLIQQASFLSDNVQCSAVTRSWHEADVAAFLDDYYNYIMKTESGREFMYEHAERTGKRVRNVNRTYRHKEYPFLQGHIDKKIEGLNAGVEIKNVGLRQAKYWMNQPPIYYEYQVLHYLSITGFDYFDVVALVGGQELMIHTIHRDEDRINELVKKEVEFWNEYVLKKVPPMPENPSESASLFPIGEVNKVAYLPVGDDYLIEEYHENVDLIKRTEKRNDAIKTSFQNNMKDASVCENSEGERVAIWATQTRSGLNQKQMKIDEPELCKKYATTSTFRKFSITSKKESNE